MLQHTAERDYLSAALVDTIADNLIYGVVGRGQIGQGSIFGCLLYTYLLDVKAVVNLKVVAYMGHVQGVESGLGLAQGCLHLRSLQYLLGVIG